MLKRGVKVLEKIILIVEDDTNIHNLEKDILEGSLYKTISAYSGTEAIMMVKSEKCDLVLLDIMLPGMFGNDVIKEIKKISDIPVIAVTSKSDKESKIEMFTNGADDYITKPFDVDELVFRVAAVLRRCNSEQGNIQKNEEEILTYKDINLNLGNYEVCVGSKKISLTKIEFEILKLLMTRPKSVFTKNNIHESIWADKCTIEDNSVNVHISNIRAKLSKINKEEDYIQTVWGIGFKLW